MENEACSTYEMQPHPFRQLFEIDLCILAYFDPRIFMYKDTKNHANSFKIIFYQFHLFSLLSPPPLFSDLGRNLQDISP